MVEMKKEFLEHLTEYEASAINMLRGIQVHRQDHITSLRLEHSRELNQINQEIGELRIQKQQAASDATVAKIQLGEAENRCLRLTEEVRRLETSVWEDKKKEAELVKVNEELQNKLATY